MVKKAPAFDWSALDRYSIVSHLWELHSDILNKQLSVNQLHSLLSKKIKSKYPVNVKKMYRKDIEAGLIYIGGMYYSDDDKKKNSCIEIQLIYKSKTELYNFPIKRLKRICICFADTLLHEIIHMRQYRRRKFKYIPDYSSNAEKSEQRQEQSYLGCTDEIDAYGFNIACDLVEKFKCDQNKIIKYLDKDHRFIKEKSSSWKMYLVAFDHDHDHEIIKRLKKKIIRYLPRAIEGKPYKTKDWINW
jgi:hypothetical protein